MGAPAGAERSASVVTIDLMQLSPVYGWWDSDARCGLDTVSGVRRLDTALEYGPSRVARPEVLRRACLASEGARPSEYLRACHPSSLQERRRDCSGGPSC